MSNCIMLAFVGTIIMALVSVTTVSGAENSYILCQLSGDPRLTPFTLNENARLSMISCALRNAPVKFFGNKYIKIQVVNNGSSGGNIISFIVSLLDESDSDGDVCTFTEQYFKSSAREYTCGLAKISINGSMQIQHREADLSVIIRDGPWNYNIELRTSWENANRSSGMCRDGCTPSYTTNTRSLFPRPIPQDQTTSLLAEQICDIYLKEYTKPNARVPVNLIQFVESTRQGCITDITAMGDKKYAEQALISIVSTIMNVNATSLEEIQKRTQQASAVAHQLSKIADQITFQLVAEHKAKNSMNN